MAEETETKSSGKGVVGFLKQRKGPLPVWGWGVVGIAVIILYLRYRASQSSPTAGTATTGSVPFGTAGGSLGYGPGSTGSTGSLGTPGTPPGFQGQQVVTTNFNGLQEWYAIQNGNLYGVNTNGQGGYQGWTLGNNIPNGKFVQVQQGSTPGSIILQVLDSAGNVVYTTTRDATSGQWSGGQQRNDSIIQLILGLINPSAAQAGTPHNSSGGLLTGGNPAPIQPPAGSFAA